MAKAKQPSSKAVRFRGADRPGFQGDFNERIRAAQETHRVSDSMTLVEREKAGRAVRTVREQVAAELTAHCDPCPDCESMPIAVEQPKAIEREWVTIEYEIGCPVCPPKTDPDTSTTTLHRVRRATHALAVEAWNAQQWEVRAATAAELL